MSLNSQDWLAAQHGVLGSALIEPKLVPEILSQTSAEDYSGSSLAVYQAIRFLFSRGMPVDVISVRDKLGDSYTKYIMQLMEITPTAANYQHYIDLCRKQSRIYRLKEIGGLMADACDMDEMEKLLEQAISVNAKNHGIQCVSAHQALLNFVERHSEGTPPDFFSWPIPELDKELFIEHGDFVLIGGRPSAGKTAFALQTAWHLSQTKNVGFFSLETGERKLTDRQVAAVSGVPLDSIKQNALNQQHWNSIISLDSVFKSHQLDIITQSDITLSELQAFAKAKAYDAIFIDYLQILRVPGVSRYETVTEISLSMHRFAQASGIAVYGLVQLNRGNSEHKKAEPDMASIKESGQLEQDADVVLMLHLDKPEDPASPRVLRAVKNKEGERFRLYLKFDGKHQKFEKLKDYKQFKRDMARITQEIKEQERYDKMQQMTLLPQSTAVPPEFLKT